MCSTEYAAISTTFLSYFYRFLQYFYSILWCERPRLMYPTARFRFFPLRCDAIKVCKANKYPKECRAPQPRACPNAPNPGACATCWPLAPARHTARPMWTALARHGGRHTPTPHGYRAVVAGARGALGPSASVCFACCSGLGQRPLSFAVGFATRKSHTTKTI